MCLWLTLLRLDTELNISKCHIQYECITCIAHIICLHKCTSMWVGTRKNKAIVFVKMCMPLCT